MTKLERLEKAKKQTIQSWKRSAEFAFNDGNILTPYKSCGFCDIYKNYKKHPACKSCPIFQIEDMPCYRVRTKEKDSDRFTYCLAVLIYIHQF